MQLGVAQKSETILMAMLSLHLFFPRTYSMLIIKVEKPEKQNPKNSKNRYE